jgi:hypothetical protein
MAAMCCRDANLGALLCRLPLQVLLNQHVELVKRSLFISHTFGVPGWQTVRSRTTGKSYYFHTETGETRWRPPDDENDFVPTARPLTAPLSGHTVCVCARVRVRVRDCV